MVNCFSFLIAAYNKQIVWYLRITRKGIKDKVVGYKITYLQHVSAAVIAEKKKQLYIYKQFQNCWKNYVN